MKQIALYILIVLTCVGQEAFSQNEKRNSNHETYFIIKGSVRESKSFKPISNVTIEINGGAFGRTESDGSFKIRAKKGDLLIIRHKDFETVYHTVESDERITVEVEPEVSDSKRSINKRNVKAFNAIIDSAEAYKKTNAEKSIQFILAALKESKTTVQNAEAYEVSADVYMHWKQYDLAITNYKISLQNAKSNDVSLKLAKAYRLNKQFQESLNSLQSISIKELSPWEKTSLYEEFGNAYYDTKDYNNSIVNYQKGLNTAQKHLLTPKITDLNSKIAEAHTASGQTTQAKNYYSNSLKLAEEENMSRALKERVKVADFEHKIQSYDDEIELRKDAIESIGEIESDSIISNKSSLTPQKQNYKIGNAYFLQKDYDSAIPYLQKSKELANERGDLIVEKDATKKLSDVFESAGDDAEALRNYKDYKAIVDELYIKKEQEISQAARFSRRITESQNRITGLETDRELSLSKYQYTNEHNKRQQLIIYSLLGGLGLLLIAAYFMYKSMKQQKLANNLLALKSLRSQMNPHFIFNALNSVNGFIALNDERTANKYLSDFSQLMRAVLENSEEDFIPLQKEIELIELYTKLEHSRFKDKFEYDITIDEAIDVGSFKIPPMLLQPYIENAVWHGLRYKSEKGKLSINMTQKNTEELSITISDNGIGRKRSKADEDRPSEKTEF